MLFINYSSHEALTGCRWLRGDITAPLLDYGRSVLSDVPTVQSAAAKWHAANPVFRGAGPPGRG